MSQLGEDEEEGIMSTLRRIVLEKERMLCVAAFEGCRVLCRSEMKA